MLSLRCVSVSLLLLSCGARAAPRGVLELPGPGELSGPGEQPLTLQALGAQPADQETYGYLVPRLASKYRPSLGWGVGPGALMPDPRLYVLTELDNYPESEEQVRYKRKMSLSIVSPMSNLRQRLLMEIARKQMRDNEIQAEKNREMLNSVGKRSDHHFQHHFQQPDNQFSVDNGSNTL